MEKLAKPAPKEKKQLKTVRIYPAKLRGLFKAGIKLQEFVDDAFKKVKDG